ncbi:hypothetical protein C8F01DRAFT_1112787 [Mycena amicta]|nr:hypothetical protein C8F01DRAFT_1112787 [Mycena amicta]
MTNPASIRVAPRIRVALVQLRPKLGQVQTSSEHRSSERALPENSSSLCRSCLLSGDGVQRLCLCQRGRHPSLPRVSANRRQKLGAEEIATTSSRSSSNPVSPASGPVGANSTALFGPDGEWLGGSRKTNLYSMDMTWAKPGNGFATFTIPLRTGTSQSARVSVGICMDLNAAPPYDWTTEEGPYELADYALSQQADLLLLLNAWLDSREEVEHEYDLSTLSFWSQRLRPLWTRNSGAAGAESDARHESTSTSSDSDRDTLVAICNRGGSENETKYAGCSAVFRMRRGAGEKGILRAVLRREYEDVLIWPTPMEGEDREEDVGSSSEDT